MTNGRWFRWCILATLAVTCGIGLAATPLAAAPIQQSGTGALQAAFAAAAEEFAVPQSVLLSVSYNLSRWEQHHGQPSVAGGYGPMHLIHVDRVPALDGRGDGVVRSEHAAVNDPTRHTLDAAAALLGVSPEVLKSDPSQNIRGAAALLARYVRETAGGPSANADDWYGAVAKYSGSSEAIVALDFADSVFATIQQGAARTTADGQHVALGAGSVRPNKVTAAPLHLRNSQQSGVECPNGIECNIVAAAYQINTPGDTSDYGNYDVANRPADGLDVRYIVIHDTEVNFADTVRLFQNPLAYVSSHYVVRSSDGLITQMVPTRDVAWHAGNWYVNSHAIGIEHEGFAIEGATWYTEPMYHASARLVHYLAQRYAIPLDRAHIIGHDDVPGPTPFFQPRQHWDPGPYWDWAHYMELVGAPIPSGRGGPHDGIVTIDPRFDANQPPVTYCDPTCRDITPQPSSFVYLRTAPNASAPLLDDPALPGPGTTQANDWGDKASTGQQFYRFAQQGDWDGIYFGGQQAWFFNPRHNTNAVAGSGMLITPKAGASSIPVYGRAYPEASAYAGTGIAVQSIVPLQYNLPAGQIYVATDQVKADYYFAPTYTLNPADHTVVKGQDVYDQIFFNHRLAFVKATDVEVVPAR